MNKPNENTHHVTIITDQDGNIVKEIYTPIQNNESPTKKTVKGPANRSQLILENRQINFIDDPDIGDPILTIDDIQIIPTNKPRYSYWNHKVRQAIEQHAYRLYKKRHSLEYKHNRLKERVYIRIVKLHPKFLWKKIKKRWTRLSRKILKK